MGNTGISVSGSSANAIYNPAGIPYIEDKRLSVSGSAYTLIKAKFDGGNDQEPLEFSTYNSVPNMVASSKKFDTWTVTYGLFIPSAIEIEADYETPFPAISGNARLTLYSKSEEQFLGVSSGRKTTNGWSYGLSFFGHRYHEINSSTAFLTPTLPASPTSPYITSSEKVDLEVISLLAILGVQKIVSDDFKWGIRLNLPGLPVFDQSQVYSEAMVYDGTNLSKANLDETNKGAEYALPADLGFGMSLRLSPRQTLLVDISAQSATSYETIPTSDKGYKVKLKTTIRSNVGYQNKLTDKLTLLAGLNWNPSTIKSRIKNENGDADAPLNFISVTGGIYHKEENVVTGIGGFYAISRTDHHFFSGDEPDDSTAINAMGLILSSSINY